MKTYYILNRKKGKVWKKIDCFQSKNDDYAPSIFIERLLESTLQNARDLRYFYNRKEANANGIENYKGMGLYKNGKPFILESDPPSYFELKGEEFLMVDWMVWHMTTDFNHSSSDRIDLQLGFPERIDKILVYALQETEVEADVEDHGAYLKSDNRSVFEIIRSALGGSISGPVMGYFYFFPPWLSIKAINSSGLSRLLWSDTNTNVLRRRLETKNTYGTLEQEEKEQIIAIFENAIQYAREQLNWD